MPDGAAPRPAAPSIGPHQRSSLRVVAREIALGQAARGIDDALRVRQPAQPAGIGLAVFRRVCRPRSPGIRPPFPWRALDPGRRRSRRQEHERGKQTTRRPAPSWRALPRDGLRRARRRPQAFGQAAQQLIQRHRASVQPALRLGDAMRGHRHRLLDGFDALGDDVQVQRPGQFDDLDRHRPARPLVRDACLREELVQLQVVQRKDAR